MREAEEKTLIALAEATRECCYPKGTIISQGNKNTGEIYIVSCGLLKVSAISESGKRITFLLAKKGEPYNILSPFMKEPRQFIAEAAKDTRCLQMSRAQYMQFIESHPEFLIHIISYVAPALDSTISRIFDQMEKKVEFRIMRVLKTLSTKFGAPLFFTNAEIAELAGTTTESAIRAMAVLRDLGAIETERGKIWVKDLDILQRDGMDNIRV